jgi:hypothetical protein
MPSSDSQIEKETVEAVVPTRPAGVESKLEKSRRGSLRAARRRSCNSRAKCRSLRPQCASLRLNPCEHAQWPAA